MYDLHHPPTLFLTEGFLQPLADGQTSGISPRVTFAFTYSSNKIIQKGIDEGLQSEAVDAGKKNKQTHTQKGFLHLVILL